MMPEQIKLAATYADGGVAIVSFVTKSFNPDGSVQFTQEPSDAAIAKVCRKISLGLPSPIVSWRIVSDEDVPNDRDYRNAWRDSGTRIEHDMPKAREIHREKLRRERGPRLAALDVEYQRADEQDDAKTKRDVAARKQRLRDAPADPRIDAAQTVDDLRRITLD